MQQRRQRAVSSRSTGDHASINAVTAGSKISQTTALSDARRNSSTGTVVFLTLLTIHGVCGIRRTFYFTPVIECVLDIQRWSNSHRLMLNAAKSECIWLGM